MPLFLYESDIEQVLTMEEVVTAVEEGFRLIAQNRAVNRPRHAIELGPSKLRVMPAAVDGIGFGLKAWTVSSKGERFVVVLWDIETGDLQAIIEARTLGQRRTGAATGVATKYLARKNAETVGVFGSGWQASSQLAAVCAVRPIRHVWIYSPTLAHREQFAREMTEKLGVTVEAVSEPRQAVVKADIIITITTAQQPVFDGAWLQPGTHINVAGSHAGEVDLKTIRQASVITTDDHAQAQFAAGALIAAVEGDVITWDDVVELSQVMDGTVSGRQNDDEITLFESTGIAVEDVVVARLAYEKARKQGAGTPLPETYLA